MSSILNRGLREHAPRRTGAGLACLALLLTTSSLQAGQVKAAGDTSRSPQAGKGVYRFEVASIHPADPGGQMSGMPTPSPVRFVSGNTTICGLAMKAFGLKQGYQLKYKPWMLTTHFFVNATFPEGASQADLPVMIQHLLEDRFGLVFHRETQKMAGYDLVVAKSGPKLTKSTAADEAPSPSGGIVVKNGVPQFAANASGILMTTKGATLRGHNKTTQDLASALAGSLRQPVVDATGLDGEYDYTVRFIPEELLAMNGAIPPVREDGAASLPLPEALQSQLGLKLQPAKDIPTEVVVLDDARKEPIEN